MFKISSSKLIEIIILLEVLEAGKHILGIDHGAEKLIKELKKQYGLEEFDEWKKYKRKR